MEEPGPETTGTITPTLANRESQLTAVTTSPPAIDRSDLAFSNVKKTEEPGPSKSVESQDVVSQEKREERTNEYSTTGNRLEGLLSEKESYESSELSDLGEEDSGAETDKMGFLDDDDNSEKRLDLQALSNLTQIARIKEIDSDDGDDLEHKNKDNGSIRPKEAEAEAELGDDSVGDPPAEHSANNAVDHKEEVKEEDDVSLGAKRKGPDNTKDAKRRSIEQAKSEEDDNVQEEDAEAIGEAEVEDEVEEDDAEEDEAEDDEVAVRSKAEVEVGAEAEAEAEAEDDGAALDSKNDDQIEDNFENGVDMNEQRKLAVADLIDIEKSFAELRDKLYNDKLTLLEHELQLCLEGSHPGLSKIYHKVNEFYEDSIGLANSNLTYNLKCIDRETVATRTNIHQNFIRKLMDSKSEMISDTTSKWYKINKERNQMDQLVPEYNFSAIPQIPNYTVAGPIYNYEINSTSTGGALEEFRMAEAEDQPPISKKSLRYNTLVELVQQRNNFNHQLGVLNGLVQYYGFPAAMGSSLIVDDDSIADYDLLLKKATDEEIKEDLQAMGIPL